MGEQGKFIKAEVAKVDSKLGLVFGWAIVCTEKGVDHYDKQGDHIPEDVMVDATTDFMLNSRSAHDMHKGQESLHGTVVHSFPLTHDIAEKMGIVTNQTGWMVAMKPSADILAKYEDGTYRGFSIGGGCAYQLEDDA